MKPVQIVDNIPLDFEGEVDNPLVVSKFSSVQSLILHITGLEEDELMEVSGLGFKGESKGFNPKVVEGIKYEIRAQMKDHQKTRGDRTGNIDLV